MSALSIISSSIESGIEKVEQESTVTLIDSLREILISARSFLKLIQSPIYPSLYDTGGYLQISLSETDSIIYIADTSKFTTSGKLMIDGEIIKYNNKLYDRFYNTIRGIDGTSSSTHDAGTLVRQYSENVSIISAGLSGAGSTSEIISIGYIQTGSVDINIVSTIQKVIEPKINVIEVNSYRFIESGIVDFYVNNNETSFGSAAASKYLLGNVGNNISTLESLF